MKTAHCGNVIRTGGPRGKRGGKAGGRREGGKQPPKSAADLDAEMEVG